MTVYTRAVYDYLRTLGDVAEEVPTGGPLAVAFPCGEMRRRVLSACGDQEGDVADAWRLARAVQMRRLERAVGVVGSLRVCAWRRADGRGGIP